ncbi:MAPEG family protein [Loktanella sp. SALINAS62]|uniref:MAPEG family protein n=1 Tax=Loktanella sp. SALINAS62 TaxID=2706124 RepID=UPI001B8C3572|nr:MAPEG family protein [Loktanella sp. SALINAS62]MBS1304207.1 MAPEG family protein [Loktanella sp. SALINAS62]
MDGLSAYHPALAVLGLWAVLLVVLSGLSLRGRTDDDLCACGSPRRDYANPVYRRHRAYHNALETNAPFLAAAVAAVLTGAAPFWVNGLCVVFLLARVVMAVVHIRSENQPLRSACYAVGWFALVGLAVLAVFAAL